MSDLLLGLVIGLVLGMVLGAVAVQIYRLRVKKLRNARTRAELKGNRVSTVAQMLHFAIQSAPSAVVVVDKRRNVVLSNTRAHELSLVHERSVNREVWEAVEKVFADQEPREVAFTPPPRRGNRPVIAVAGLAQLLSLQDDRYAVVYATDDSEHIRMESARRDFVANVSHELKTPVGAISLLTETLISEKEDPESVEYFGTKLINESRRMSQMISELIALSKLQGAESLPDPEVLSLDDIVEEAFDRCRLSAEAADIELVKDSGVEALVHGDKALLVTSVTNLVTNAINYSPAGTSVSISREMTENQAIVRVTDRGIGIAPEDQKRLFERFFRVDKARSRNTGGTGLGLAIVKHVMANHGGSVSVWSRVGTGSTFTLELPRYKGEGNALPEGEQPVVPSQCALSGGEEEQDGVREHRVNRVRRRTEQGGKE
ncbi:sensor histidine kinase [Corynebacterium anserum]|uniref:Sensor-like histidine kinase SenX3 n=1 Tax=Corynebacterium anserum TaxID=2684406 RepID=A0A7G7YQ80_9CORY|nr:ATP-binding protein [Corynebacterium anserum]MBC2682323.1 two-component sensor histidine kinase [Corynebacterium anserum]QNH96650.1 two-component sensor histidine kinase [Corynebacterium anserum]